MSHCARMQLESFLSHKKLEKSFKLLVFVLEYGQRFMLFALAYNTIWPTAKDLCGSDARLQYFMAYGQRGCSVMQDYNTIWPTAKGKVYYFRVQ